MRWPGIARPVAAEAPAATSAAAERRRMVALVFVLATALGLLSFAYNYLDEVARAENGTPLVPLIEELTGYWGAALALPAVVYMARRFPPARSPRMLAHLPALVALSVAGTTWNWAVRSLVFPVAGLGAYDYGHMPVRYVMEFPKGASGYLFTIVLVTLIDRARAFKERELRVAQLEASLARAQLHGLTAQLQPHFLFNALNAVSSIMYQDVRAADRMLAHLSDLLRYSLRASRAQLIPLSQELDLLSRYVEVMRARFGDRLHVEVRVAQEARGWMVPPMMLQPLVENALSHGAPPPPEPARVVVDAGPGPGGTLVLRVTDNGPGLDPARATTGDGVGLANTRDRLAALFGGGAALEFAPATMDGGLTVTITIPQTREAA